MAGAASSRCRRKALRTPGIALPLIFAAAAAHAALPPGVQREPLQAHLERFVELEFAPGIIAGTTSVAGTAFLSAGTHRFGGTTPVGPDTRFNIGKAGRTLTAALCALHAEAGTWSWDEPLAGHLPGGFSLPQVAGATASIAQAAGHYGALPPHPADWEPPNPRFPLHGLQAPALSEALAVMVPPFAPGERFYESDFGYALLGLALEHAGGQSYAALLESKLARPLGMHHTAAGTARPGSDPAPGHFGLTEVDFPPHQLAGMGMQFSSARDMLAFVAAHIPMSRTPLHPALRQTRTHVGPTTADDTAATRGWYLTRREGSALFWSRSVYGGYAAFLGYDPARQVGAVVLANGREKVDAIGFHLLAPQVFPLPALDQGAAVPASTLRAYAGVYRLAPGVDITVTVDGGRLYAETTGESRFRLYARDRRTFVLGEAALLTFATPQDGQSPSVTFQQGRTRIKARRAASP